MSPVTSLSPSWWPAWAWLEEAASLSIVFLRTLLPSATRLLLPAFRSSWLRVLQHYASSLHCYISILVLESVCSNFQHLFDLLTFIDQVCGVADHGN